MKIVGKSKVSKLTPKPGVVYPFVRLPQEYQDLIGKTVSICETERDGIRALLLVTCDDTTKPIKVIQPDDTKNLEKRVFELENDIKEIRQSLIEKYQQNNSEIEISGRPGRNSNPSRLRDRQT
jgi:hypothetical protein